MSRNQLRKEAYKYVLERLSSLPPPRSSGLGSPPNISLSDLILLKEDLADPSAELVASLKQLLRGSVVEAEIDAHLVVSFNKF
ncbi:hypothetical protein ES707_11402 [subsurface metagenome]